jgi:Flp pilus assembly protein TadG
VAALEFALLLPLLMILVVGVIVIGHGLVTRYILSSAAYDAARTCALARAPTAGCARAIVNSRIGSASKWCRSLNVSVNNAAAPGYPAVTALEVRADCAYTGVIGTSGFASKQGLSIAQVRARAVMPY